MDHGPASETRRPPALRAGAAELFGTFALTFIAAGAEVMGKQTGGIVDHVSRAVAPALMVMALIYSSSHVSGTHINPGVTLTFALRGAFPWARVPLYWAAQIAGAVLAALLVGFIFGNAGSLGATLPKVGELRAFWTEVAFATLLYMVIVGTAERNAKIGPHAAIAVGGTIALAGLVAGPLSGASMNPARSLGPALVSGNTAGLWIYLAGPLVASLITVALCYAIHDCRAEDENEAAQGGGS